MMLGKTIGKDNSNQQAYIQKHFRYKPIENDSEAEMVLANFSPVELVAISYRGVMFALAVTALFILILGTTLIVVKNIY